LFCPSDTTRFHCISPSVFRQHNTKSSSSADVRKMRSPHTIGVEPALPGNGVRHATFSVLLQVAGRPVSLLTPSLFGPRQRGQFSARAGVKNRSPVNAQTKIFGKQYRAIEFMNSPTVLVIGGLFQAISFKSIISPTSSFSRLITNVKPHAGF
jgi:hypothetical protein